VYIIEDMKRWEDSALHRAYRVVVWTADRPSGPTAGAVAVDGGSAYIHGSSPYPETMSPQCALSLSLSLW
jgi:hypothetical protein